MNGRAKGFLLSCIVRRRLYHAGMVIIPAQITLHPNICDQAERRSQESDTLA